MGHVFRLALVGLAIYLYFQGSVFWAAFCVIVLAWSVLGQDIARLFGLVGRLTNVPQEHDANCILTYTISLNQVFAHPVPACPSASSGRAASPAGRPPSSSSGGSNGSPAPKSSASLDRRASDNAMATFDRITSDPKRMNDRPFIRDVRLTVRGVVEAPRRPSGPSRAQGRVPPSSRTRVSGRPWRTPPPAPDPSPCYRGSSCQQTGKHDTSLDTLSILGTLIDGLLFRKGKILSAARDGLGIDPRNDVRPDL